MADITDDEVTMDESEETTEEAESSSLEALGDDLLFLRGDNMSFYLASKAYYEDQNYEEAIEKYQAAIEYEKSRPQDSLKLADSSENSEEKAQEKKPNDVIAKSMYWLGESYVKTNQTNPALKTFEQLASDLSEHYLGIAAQRRVATLNNVTVSIASPQSTRQEVELRNRTAQIQQRKLPEQTIQKINKQKLIDRRRFANLSAKAMNPNVEICYPLPKLDDCDMQLVEKWHHLPRNSLDRLSLIKAENRDRELGRLLSARSAEKVAADFYRHYGKKVKDISITQIDENSKSDWINYDLDVDGMSIDVKNSRKSQKSEDRYTEHYIQKGFKRNKENQEVKIAGVLSCYLMAMYITGSYRI